MEKNVKSDTVFTALGWLLLAIFAPPLITLLGIFVTPWGRALPNLLRAAIVSISLIIWGYNIMATI